MPLKLSADSAAKNIWHF